MSEKVKNVLFKIWIIIIFIIETLCFILIKDKIEASCVAIMLVMAWGIIGLFLE